MISRKNFLMIVGGGILAGLFASTTTGISLSSILFKKKKKEAYTLLSSFFPDRQAVAKVGYTCYTYMPKGTTASSLTQELFGDEQAISVQNSKKILNQLQQKHLEDLQNLHLFQANGWIFSKTEAQTYSLFYLLSVV